MSEKLTKAQRALIIRMGFASNALRNGDEGCPKWWIEGGEGVKANVAESLVRRGWVKLTGRWGGHPGVLGFTITPAGRSALSE